MNKTRILLLLLLTFAAGLTLSRYAFAETPKAANTAGNMTLQCVAHPVSDLTDIKSL